MTCHWDSTAGLMLQTNLCFCRGGWAKFAAGSKAQVLFSSCSFFKVWQRQLVAVAIPIDLARTERTVLRGLRTLFVEAMPGRIFPVTCQLGPRLSAAAGAPPSPGHVLDIGAYGLRAAPKVLKSP